MFSVYLDHHGQVVQVAGAAEIVEVVQIKGRVFSYKFYVVVVTRVADGLDHGRPGRVDMGA